ncbi:MAG TPA: hypothetical protein VGU22_17380 [Methylomirabilota bacterium]|jgi:hypothetical protein|nr:hypothetical protein [Methylomirabilota bacterium]
MSGDARQDAMPTTRGLNFFTEDPNLEFHVVAAALLLAEGQVLLERRRDCRKLLVGALYVRRWLRPVAPPAPMFSAGALRWLDAPLDWTAVPEEPLALACLTA